MKKIVILIISITLLTACSDSTSSYDKPPQGTISIAHLKSLAATESYIITDDIAIEGHVVANDLYGEFYKSIVICDNSAGIEIAIDSRKTATQFPISAHVTVYCSGLCIGDYGGQLTLGVTPIDKYSVSRISEKDILRYFLVDKDNPQTIKPTTMNIRDINTTHIGNFIRIDNVTFGTQAGSTWCEQDPLTEEYITTERIVTNKIGDTFTIRCIGECKYNSEPLPSGYGSICGIVEYFNQEYSLRVVNHLIEFND